MSLSWNAHPLTLSAGRSTRGPLFGVSLALDGHGELWSRYDGDWAAGVEVIPMDYTRFKAEWNAQQDWRAHATYALPWNAGEGRPVRCVTGWDTNWYVGGAYRFGSFEVTGRVHPLARKLGVGFSSMW